MRTPLHHLALLAALACATAPAAQPSDDERQILAVHQARMAAVKRSDASAWLRLVADDYVSINDGGELQTRAELAKQWSEREHDPIKITDSDETEMSIRVHGDVAIMTYRSRWDDDLGGVHRGSYARYTEVYQRRGDHWLGLSKQETDIPYSAVTPAAAHPERYADLAGRYRVGVDFVITVTQSGGKLYEQWAGETEPVELLPLDDSCFYSVGQGQTYEFVRDAAGKVLAHRIRDGAGELLALRLD